MELFSYYQQMKLPAIEITCDMGEGLNNESLLMPYIHSCSIACGYHAGDIMTMRETVSLAKKYDVIIGAHPSYPDREGFGRRDINLSTSELINIIKDQIIELKSICNELLMPLTFLKPHGALYNKAVKDKETALAIVQAILETDKNLWIYTPYKSLLAQTAIKHTIKLKYEVFGDRNYSDDLSLLSRELTEAVIYDPEKVIDHVSYMVPNQCIKSISGKLIPVKADVLCIHGDNPNALNIVRELHAWLQK